MNVITSEPEQASLERSDSHEVIRDLNADLYGVLCATHDSERDLEHRLSAILSRYTSAIAVLYYVAGDGESPVSVWVSHVPQLPSNVLTWSVSLANRCLVEGCARTETSQDTGDAIFQLSAAPIMNTDGQCLVAFHQSRDCSIVEYALTQTAIALGHARNARSNVAKQLAALQDLIVRTEAASTREEAASSICANLAEYLESDHVVMALADRNSRLRVVAASNQDQISESQEPVRLAGALMQESACRREVSTWPTEGNTRHALLCHRQYAESEGLAHVVGCPLFDHQGELRGAILVAFKVPPGGHVLPFLKSAQKPLATAVHLVHRAERNRVMRTVGAAFSAGRRGRIKATFCWVGLLIAVLCLPLRYTVKAPCKLEPTNKRYLAAPFAGKLLQCFVKPGDAVEAGQLMALLDGQETEWELASVSAELQRAIKERAGYIAEHESGKARLAQHEIEYLRSKSQLLAERVSQLEVRSPVDGIVVSGDLTKAEGVPLEIGQTLFEISPLDSMISEMSVPQDDVRFIKEQLPVKIRFDAFPYEPYETTLTRIRPRAEIRDDRNVFIADSDIKNEHKLLRPGMDGIARIRTFYRPIGWILLHKPTAAAVRWLGF